MDGDRPENLTPGVPPFRNVHSHITRGNNDLHVTVVNKNYGKKKSQT